MGEDEERGRAGGDEGGEEGRRGWECGVMRGKERRTDYLRCSLVFKFPLLCLSLSQSLQQRGREGGRELL